MAQPTPAYRFRSPLPGLLVVADEGDQSSIEVLDPSGAAEAPASGTYELVDSTGTVKASGSISVDGTTVISSTVATGSLEPGDAYRERWRVTMDDGVEASTEREAIVCRFLLSCPIGPADITRMSPQLDPDFDKNISGTLDLDEFIDEAWVQIQNRLIAAGRRPWLSISSHALRESALELTHALIYDRLSTERRHYTDHADRHRMAYRDAWNRVRLTYQTPSGSSVKGKRGSRSPTLYLGSPTRRGDW